MDVVLPKNSLTMTEAEILEWYVPEGGEVVVGEPLFLMETEKSQVEVEATVSGRLTQIRCAPGTVASAGEVIAVVETGGFDRSFTGQPAGERTVAPAAAELAAHLDIDLDSVRGSGTGGRVIEEDVLKAAEQSTLAAPTAGDEVAPARQEPRRHRAEFSKNRTVGNEATKQAAAVPTFQLSTLVTVPSGVRADRATASDLLVAAAAAAAREVPVANALFDAGAACLYDDIRVGLLVRDGDALLPLVFADPDRADLGELHQRRREWMSQLGKSALPAQATAWPTIVVSNIGRPSVRWFSAVLYPGTAVTLAVGGLGAPGPDQADVVLTCDHRVLDGVDAADFAAAFATALRTL